jgi:hypothetical protein
LELVEVGQSSGYYPVLAVKKGKGTSKGIGA